MFSRPLRTSRSSATVCDPFAIHFLLNHQEFDEMLLFNGSGKKTLTLTLSPEYRGEGTHSSPLSDIGSHHGAIPNCRYGVAGTNEIDKAHCFFADSEAAPSRQTRRRPLLCRRLQSSATLPRIKHSVPHSSMIQRAMTPRVSHRHQSTRFSSRRGETLQ